MATNDSDSSIRVYMREIVKTDLLTPEQEVELAGRIRDGDESAREHMIKANLRLVVKIARDYSNYGVPMADLISCLLYTSPSPRDQRGSRMPSSA